MNAGRCGLLALLLTAATACAQEGHPCRYTLHLDAQGRLYEGRHVRISRTTLIRDLKNGCHSGPVESVLVSADKKTAYGKVKDVIDLMQQYGPPGVNVAIKPIK